MIALYAEFEQRRNFDRPVAEQTLQELQNARISRAWDEISNPLVPLSSKTESLNFLISSNIDLNFFNFSCSALYNNDPIEMERRCGKEIASFSFLLSNMSDLLVQRPEIQHLVEQRALDAAPSLDRQAVLDEEDRLYLLDLYNSFIDEPYWNRRSRAQQPGEFTSTRVINNFDLQSGSQSDFRGLNFSGHAFSRLNRACFFEIKYVRSGLYKL